ncbi:FtsK/SpoIIIE domain-containing protein [Microbacterium halotolerans]|uniref:FtsK/SpoIIIE domain-containing protein n=1 Tax=Microbacterium halotolerans TaxID=246613 RepID=UPI0013C32E3B|nr:FtsK/SpoIIIE domain-containing protein [Microbacterium halotolerans]
MLIPFLPLAALYAVPGVGQVVNWLFVVVVIVIVLRRVRAARNLDAVLHRRWQEAMTKRILAVWPTLVVTLKLGVRDFEGRNVFMPIARPTWSGWACDIGVAPPPGLAIEDINAVVGRIREAFGASRVAVIGQASGNIALRVQYVDVLEQPFLVPEEVEWDGRSVSMGLAEDGSEWRLPVGPHTLVAGSSGSGKASLIWGLLLGLRHPIHDGTIEVWGIDRKGGMELALGKDLLTRFADDAAHSVALLEDAVEQMQARARRLAGVTRQHVASSEMPTVIVLIDELAALTAYENDRDTLRRANAAIATLASQGRAVGFIVFACLQDPRKETLPARGLFTQTVGLRLRDRTETAMVLGDGAVAAGALCHEISSSMPGTAYVLDEAGSPPRRVRAAYASDGHIRSLATAYQAPHQRPVHVPEPEHVQPKPRRARGRRTERKSREETS